MELLVIAVLTGVVGLGLGVAGILAFRFSERSRDTTDFHSDGELPDGIAEVLAVVPSAAVVIDAGNDVVKASPASYTYGLVRGHSLASIDLAEVVERVRVRGLIEELDFEQTRSPESRTTRYLHARVAPLGTAFVLVLCDDHTESRRVDAVRRDFVANVSHELKTPIGAISLLAEAVTDFSDDPEAVERFGGRMQQESKRLSQLVQEIIDLSRVQDHEAPAAAETVSVAEVVKDAVDRASTAAEAKSIELGVSTGEDWYVSGSYELLVNAVRNLVDNAINYSNEGTRVGVGVRLVDERVGITVTDQGIGLSTEDTERVFERFYRVDPARSRVTGGTGLGLSIVKHIVATHNGEMKVWSKLGQGSTFTILLPLSVPPGEEPGPGNTGRPPQAVVSPGEVSPDEVPPDAASADIGETNTSEEDPAGASAAPDGTTTSGATPDHDHGSADPGAYAPGEAAIQERRTKEQTT
ncbi:sensor histidine kinase [Brevibacterium litoralis]|uniref:sensor histidine kinase n=1 Tax=Brevibacterium litoralis TaxID=3138935 RepID=UPI0032F00854